MTTTQNFRPAGMSSQDRLNVPTECGCCGREGLKTTVKMVDDNGSILWMGTGCAAKAMGVGVDLFKRAAKDADAVIANENIAAQRAETDRWFAFLDANVPGLAVTEQIAALGGLAAARAAFRTA